MMTKMQVPAYCPVVDGTHAVEYSGVPVEVKNTTIMEEMDIFVESALVMVIAAEVVADIAAVVVEDMSTVADGECTG